MNQATSDLVDELVRQSLLDTYIMAVTDLVEFEDPDCRKFCKSIRRVLKWYSTTEQFNKLPKLPNKVK